MSCREMKSMSGGEMHCREEGMLCWVGRECPSGGGNALSGGRGNLCRENRYPPYPRRKCIWEG